jgi:hypothetical protein
MDSHLSHEMIKLRQQELLEEAAAYRRTQLLLPPRSPFTRRLRQRLGTLFITLGQTLKSGAGRAAQTACLLLLLVGAVVVSPANALGSDAGWQRYHDPVAGLTLDYPQDWAVAQSV